VTTVSLDVGGDLPSPVRRIVAPGQAAEAFRKIPAMPEVPIDEDDDAKATEHDIRSSGQITHGDAISESKPPKGAAKDKLTAGVAFPTAALGGR